MRQTIIVGGYKIILHQAKEQQISITATSSLTQEVFSVHNYQLVKITAMTISAAFKQNSPTLKYQLTRHQKSLILIITINLEYLPIIQESIIIPLLEGKTANKLAQINDMKEQIQIINHQFENLNKHKAITIGKLTSGPNRVYTFQQKLEVGKYLIEMSGYTLCQPLNYDEQNWEQEDYKTLNTKLILNIETLFQEAAIESERIEKGIAGSSGYETPFSLTKLIKLQKPGSIKIQATCTTYQLTINESIIIISSATLNTI